MVLNHDNRVWLGRRRRKPGKVDEFVGGEPKLWQMPQGGIDGDEDPLAAARRELWEETGIRSIELLAQSPDWLRYDLPAHLIGKALKGKYRGQKQMWFAFRFLGADDEINIAHPPHGAPVEFDAWEWADPESIVGRVIDFKRPLYEEVVETFGHLWRD